MVQLLFLFLLGLTWWFLFAYIPDWNFHRRPVSEMTTKKLMDVYYHWFKGYAFQDHGEMFYVQRKYMKASAAQRDEIMIVAYKRVLEIQEELLRRGKASNEQWQIDYVNRLLREIESTKESLALYRKVQKPVLNQYQDSAPPKIVTDLTDSPQKLTPTQLSSVDHPQCATTVQPNNEVSKQKEKKAPSKNKTTLFIESFERYLLESGTSTQLCVLLKQVIRKSKSIPIQSGAFKELLARKLEGYIEQASEHELDMYGELIEKLLGYTDSDT